MTDVLLIDGNSMVFRAFYATIYGRPMKTSNGITTNAVFGFNKMLDKALDLIKPQYVLVAFDTSSKTFRSDLYSEYKGTRVSLPEELIVQFPIVRELLDNRSIKYIEYDGFEADDIIGSYSKMINDRRVSILTGDKDLLQLIDSNTDVWIMRKGISEMERFDEEYFFSKYGISPIQMIDLKGLMGDQSDNIPGIFGVGEKTALTLIKQFGSVEEVVKNTDLLKGKLKERIEDNKDIGLLSKKLATIVTDLDLPLEYPSLEVNTNYEDLVSFYLKYEFNSLVSEIKDKVESKHNETEFEITKSFGLSSSKEYSLFFDYVNDDYNSDIYHVAIYDGKSSIVLEFKDAIHDPKFIEFLSSVKIKYLYDAKRFMHVLNRYNLSIENYEDVMIMAYLIDNTVNEYDVFANLFNLKSSNFSLMSSDEDVSILAHNSGEIFNSYHKNYSQLVENDIVKLYTEVERPLIRVLFEMEKEGILIDEKNLDEFSMSISEKLSYYATEINSLVNKEINLNSPKQLGELLFDDLQLPKINKKSTAIDVLNKLVDKHPVVSLLIEYRKYQKILSTYTDGLKKYIHTDGCIHTVYHQSTTQTGRLSSKSPNLQNISIRNEEGSQVRKSFIAKENCVLMSADYSQVELRIMASLSNETKLINAFVENKDIHTQTAMEVFNVKESEVDSDKRRKAKAVNFGIIYGISDFGLSEQLQILRSEAKKYIDNYFIIYPNIKNYLETQVNYCEEHGYVKTVLNRRRYIPEISSSNYMTKEFGKRAAMNAPIQGSASDLIKVAMVKIYDEMSALRLKSKMILQVHDELIFNVINDEKDIMKKLIKDTMENAIKFNVPLFVDVKSGNNWFEAK